MVVGARGGWMDGGTYKNILIVENRATAWWSARRETYCMLQLKNRSKKQVLQVYSTRGSLIDSLDFLQTAESVGIRSLGGAEREKAD